MMVSAEDERMQQQPLEANAEEEFEALVGGGDAAMTDRAAKQQKQHTQQHHAPPSNGQPAAPTAAAVAGGHRNGAGSQHPQHSQSHHQPRFHPTALQGAGAKPAAASHAASHHPSHGPPAALSSRSVSAAASPSASASPHSASSLTLPFPHVPATFASSACYLHSNASPSQRDGLTANDEFMLRAHTCGFMSAIGQRLKLGQLALATASVYLQVFYTHYSFKAMDRMEIACACLFLAGKVEERRIRVDQVVSAFFVEKEADEKKWAIASGVGFAPRPRPVLDSHDWEALRQRIYEHEALLLDAVEYNFDVVHPYTFLRLFLKNYIYSSVYYDKFVSRHLHDTGGLTQIAWNFINDSLRTPLALLYSPSVICVAAIRMAMKHLILGGVLAEEPTRKPPMNLQAVPTKVKPWHEELFGVDKKTLTFIQSQITRSLELSPPAGQKNPALDLRMYEVHRKAAQGRSTVPLPVAKSTNELIKQMQAQQKQQQQQQAQQNQPRGNAPAAAAATGAGVAPSSSSSSHPDRKRARSPPIKVEGGSKRDVVVIDGDDHKQARPARSPSRASVPWITDPSYVPLDRPPSPFLEGPALHYRTKWLPDLRPSLHAHQHHREQHRSPHKQHRRDDKDRGNRHEKDPHKRAADQGASSSRNQQQPSQADAGSTKSPHGRRSQRRSNSRDRVNVQRASEAVAAAASSSSAAAAPSSSPLEEGELHVAPPVQLTSIAEESESNKSDVAMSAVDDESRMLLSPRALLARSSTSLTKSCSSLTLSSLSVSASGRLHMSASMSNLQSSAVSTAAASAAASDILSGDILRMSSSHSPADPALALSLGGGVTTVNEEDIMREINRGAKELGAAGAEEEDEEEGQIEGDAENGRKSKRARIGSRPSSPVATNTEFEGSHVKMETTVAPAVASPARSAAVPVFSSSADAPIFPATSDLSSSAALTTASSSASTATAPFSRQPSDAALSDADASMGAEAEERKRMEDVDESKVIEMKSTEEAEARMQSMSAQNQPPSAKSSPLHLAEAEAATVAAAPLTAAAPALDMVPTKSIVSDLVLPNGDGVVQPEDEQKSATAMEIAQ